MPPSHQQRIEAQQRKVLRAGIIGAPGFILLAVSLQTHFAEPLHPVLAGDVVRYLIWGGAMFFVVLEALLLYPALVEMRRINRDKQRARGQGRP